MMEDANEIQEALSRSYGTPELDEDDLEAGKLWGKQCIHSFRVWKEQLPGTFSQMLEKNSVRIPSEIVYGTVSGQRACEATTSDLYTPPTALGWTRFCWPNAWYLNTAFPCHFPLLLFFLCCYLDSSPSEQQSRWRNSSGKYLICIYYMSGTVLGVGDSALDKTDITPWNFWRMGKKVLLLSSHYRNTNGWRRMEYQEAHSWEI